MNMDWEKESSREFKVYPEGTYSVQITGYEQVTATTGTPQIRWKGTILSPEVYRGEPITTHTALTEKALFRTAKLVKGCGIDTKTLPKTEIGSPLFFVVIGACVNRATYWRLSVVPDNKGNKRNEIEDFIIDEGQKILEITDNDDDIPEELKE